MGKIAVPDLLGSAQKLLGDLKISANVGEERNRDRFNVQRSMACQRQRTTDNGLSSLPRRRTNRADLDAKRQHSDSTAIHRPFGQ